MSPVTRFQKTDKAVAKSENGNMELKVQKAYNVV